jgi:hypothetical protein
MDRTPLSQGPVSRTMGSPPLPAHVAILLKLNDFLDGMELPTTYAYHTRQPHTKLKN